MPRPGAIPTIDELLDWPLRHYWPPADPLPRPSDHMSGGVGPPLPHPRQAASIYHRFPDARRVVWRTVDAHRGAVSTPALAPRWLATSEEPADPLHRPAARFTVQWCRDHTRSRLKCLADRPPMRLGAARLARRNWRRPPKNGCNRGLRADRWPEMPQDSERVNERR